MENVMNNDGHIDDDLNQLEQFDVLIANIMMQRKNALNIIKCQKLNDILKRVMMLG
jgi:hypothetical protein